MKKLLTLALAAGLAESAFGMQTRPLTGIVINPSGGAAIAVGRLAVHPMEPVPGSTSGGI